MASHAPPLHSTITDSSHGPVVRYAAATLLSISISSVIVRLVWIRHPLRTLFGVDDLSTIVGLVLAAVQTACLLSALPHGFGHRTGNSDLETIVTAEKVIFAADVLYIVALCLSRLASSLFCLRLTREETRERTAFSALSALVAVWGVVGVLVLSIQSPYSQPWQSVLMYPKGSFVRWAATESLGILWEILLFGMVSALIWQLQMPVHKKVAVTSAFATRLPVAALAVIRIRSLQRAQSMRDFNFEYTRPQIWGQIELHYSLMAATIPCLHVFLKNLTTGWLADLKSRPETAMAAKSLGDRYGGLSIARSNRSLQQASTFELQQWTKGKTETRGFAQKGVKSDDAASEGSGSERHILVRTTVDVEHVM